MVDPEQRIFVWTLTEAIRKDYAMMESAIFLDQHEEFKKKHAPSNLRKDCLLCVPLI